MSSSCANFSAHAAGLAATQRAFWLAWKAFEAHKDGDSGDRRRLFMAARTAYHKLATVHEAITAIIWNQWDPRHLTSIERKINYTQGDTLIGHIASVLTLQALPDGRIVSGGHDNTIRIWTKDENGHWIHETLEGHTHWVLTLQALPDGRIVSGGADNTIRIWTKDENGYWRNEVLGEHINGVTTLQALPDGRIVSGGYDDTIRIWSMSENGHWRNEVLGEHINGVLTLQALPDGRIVSGGHDKTIRIWDGEPVAYPLLAD